jgi:hypothetical protein
MVVLGAAALTGGDWGLGKPLATFDQTWTFNSGELKELNVRSGYAASIRFEPSQDGTNSVYLKGQGRDKMIERLRKTELRDGTLELNLSPPAGLMLSLFHSNRAKEEIVVTLSDPEALERLSVQLDSDSLTMTDARAKNADISVDSGSIEFTNLTAGTLTMKADSGSIEGIGLHADSRISADSGSIKLEEVTGRSRLSADSGNIKLYRSDTSDTDLQADSGSVYLHLPASFAGDFDLKADSGSIRAPEAKRVTKDLVKVRSDSGNIKIEQG